MKNSRAIFAIFLLVCAAFVSSCEKSDGTSLPTKVVSVIQVNLNGQLLSFAHEPDAVTFSSNLNSAAPNYIKYIVVAAKLGNAVNFNLVFHVDSAGSGKYVMDSSSLTANSKTYTCLATKSTDKVMVTKLDAANQVYNGTFSFYAFNKSVSSDSVLVTGIYGLGQ